MTLAVKVALNPNITNQPTLSLSLSLSLSACVPAYLPVCMSSTSSHNQFRSPVSKHQGIYDIDLQLLFLFIGKLSNHHLNLSQKTYFRLFQTEKGCRRQFQTRKMAEFFKQVENTVGKRRNCSFRVISPFPHSVFKRPVLQAGKTWGLFCKVLIKEPYVHVLGLSKIWCSATSLENLDSFYRLIVLVNLPIFALNFSCYTFALHRGKLFVVIYACS